MGYIILIFISFLVIQGFSDRRVAEDRGAFPGEFLCVSPGVHVPRATFFKGKKRGWVNSEPIVFRGTSFQTRSYHKNRN